MTQFDPLFDLKLTISQSDLYILSLHDFAFHFEDCLMYKYDCLGLWEVIVIYISYSTMILPYTWLFEVTIWLFE